MSEVVISATQREQTVLTTEALRAAIFASANFSCIATDAFFSYLTKPIKVAESMEALDLALEAADDSGRPG